MRSVLSFAAQGLAYVSVLLAAGRGLSADQAPSSPGVVYMQRSSKFIVPYTKTSYAYLQTPLLRELHRQAFLIAARDQLGLSTRDEYLGDWIPTEGENAPVEIMIFHSKPTTLRVVRGFGAAKTTLFTFQPEIGMRSTGPILGFQIPMLDYRPWLFKAESLSRGDYVEALKKSGFSGEANRWKADGGVPEEIEKLLSEMTFTTQFQAVRQLHELIRGDGESPARLGALVRGYANLGVQTEFYWHPAHKVFKARALLYAQRLLSRNEHSPVALWHRAYAYGLVGFHDFALEDMQSADKYLGEMKEPQRPARPEWVDLLDAYCRCDARRLKEWQGEPRWTELASWLRYYTSRTTGERTLKVEAALKILPEMPECYPLHDGLCAAGGVITGHRATSEWLEIAGRTLYSRLRAMPGLPKPAAEIAEEMAAAAETAPREEFQLRAKLVRTLLDAETPPAVGSGAAKPQFDPGEPSWAALGLLVRELSFAQVVRRLHFESRSLYVPTKQFRELSAPLVAGHPYAAYIDTFELDEAAKRAAWEKLKLDHPEDLERQQYHMYNMYYYYYHPDKKNRMKILAKVTRTQVDLTANDMYLELEQLDVPSFNKDSCQRSAWSLLVVSPHSPYAKALAVTAFSDMFTDMLPELMEAADQNPKLCRELARKALADGRWEETAKWAKTAFELCPTKDSALLLGEAHWRQGKPELWVAALEQVLNYPDYSLDHSNICVYIARYHLKHKDWEKAATFADAAATSYSGRGLVVAADYHEGAQNWEESENLRKALVRRYPTSALNWYYFCRRTGHGDLKAARELALAHIGANGFIENNQREAAVFYSLEKKPERAAEILADHIQHANKLTAGIHLAVLHDELGDVKARDEVLNDLLATEYTTSKNFTQATCDALLGLGKMIDADLKAGGKGNIDLAEADRACAAMEKSLDAPPNYHDNFYPLCFNYLLGRYLGLHGKREEAVRYWKKCLADTEKFDYWWRTLAGAALCDLGIKPEDDKSLWQKAEK